MMTVLGYYHDRGVKSATLAQSVVAEPSFVRRSLSKLVKAGLVEAIRGKNGACHLTRPPGDISLLEIYRASTAPAVFAVHDYPIEKQCPISSNIKGCLATVLDGAQGSFERALARTSLADLVADINKRHR